MDRRFAVVIFISVGVTMGGTAAAISTGFLPFETNSTIPTAEPNGTLPEPDFYYNGTCGCYYIRR